MGYLITQILIYLLLAGLIGFLLAWVLRGARLGQRIEALENELWRLHNDTDAGSAGEREEALRAHLAAARAEYEQCRLELARLHDAAPAAAAAPRAAARAPEPELAAMTGSPPPAPAATPAGAEAGAGERPASFSPGADRPGDDLKKIKGIGLKLESILHDLGIHYFHQIAAWTPANVAWVDEHLRFRGRIQRERWIEQARELGE
jgi:predicted flap endonuclease-1-like 5' DNA nuclease